MIGRKQEISELNRIYNKNKVELVAIYREWDFVTIMIYQKI